MSFVIAAPEALVAAASDLAGIGTTLSTANAAAAAPTTRLLAAGADEVSSAIASLFSSYAQDFQALSTRVAAFHDQFVQALNAGAGWYASAEAVNVQQTLLNAANAPAEALLGRPLEVSLTKDSGLGGLIFLVKQHLGIELAKDDPALQAIFAWMLREFDAGRQTSIEWEELAPVAERQLGAHEPMLSRP